MHKTRKPIKPMSMEMLLTRQYSTQKVHPLPKTQVLEENVILD